MPPKQNKSTNLPRFFGPIFFAIFFASGAGGLAFQVVWSKAFAASVGHEFPAVLAVVTAFMAGMALGNVLLIRKTSISPHAYGWLEILIGLWGLMTVVLIPISEEIVVRSLGVNPGTALQWSVVFLVVLLSLLPATAAMGATLPAAERFLSLALNRHTTALLYGANTAGATVGAVAAAFWLMPKLGIRGSLFAFAFVNIICGIVALTLARRVQSPSATQAVASNFTISPWAARLFFCGLLGIGFEIVVIRGLSHVLENTVYTFAMVLAVYLAGNAFGAFVFHRSRLLQSQNLEVLFGLLAFASAIAALTLRWSLDLYSSLRAVLGDSLSAVALAEALTAVAFFFLPAIFMGVVWSSLAQGSLSFKRSLAWGVAINTTGSALAPAIFGLIVIPAIGLKGALFVILVSYALLGGKNKLTAISVLILALCFPLITSVRDLIVTHNDKIISLEEGVMGSVAVLENEHGARVLKFNNRFQMGGTAARVAEQRQADIPLLLHPAPRRALFIGLGTGITFHVAAYFPELQADGVELVPEIATAMRFFNKTPLPAGAKLQTHIADGRRFVRAVQQQYDVIVGDLFHPAQDGAGFLYTAEHFQAVRERLAPEGLFCQWLPVYQMDSTTLRIVMATFAKVFPSSEIWLLRFNIDLPVIGLIGRLTPPEYTPDSVERKVAAHELLNGHLRQVGLNDSIRLFGGYIGPVPALEKTPINSDLDPILIFRAPALTFRKTDDSASRILALIQEFQSPPGNLFHETAGAFTENLTKFVAARNIYFQGLKAETSGDMSAAINAYLESARTSSDFTAGYAQAIVIATGLARERPDQSARILEALITAQPDRPVARELLERLVQ